MSNRKVRGIALAGATLVGLSLVPACDATHDSPTFTDTSETSATSTPPTTQTPPATPSPTP